MALYAISDIHLSLGVDKPMDIFGPMWTNYMDRLEDSWKKTVSENDYVIIPGDISWATYLEQAVEDFRFIESLPGRKIISKGNHDYWWTTMSKLNKFLEFNGFSSISFMHNNSYRLENFILCGTRGWNSPGDDGFSSEDKKVFDRELNRLEISLMNASGDNKDNGCIIVAALHYPPFNSRKEPTGFVEIMKKFGVEICIYGHLHSDSLKNAVQGVIDGIDFKVVSADYLGFCPIQLL
ncbi:MAG: metallophosphoesterase [Acetivibrionales bacterium]